MSYPNHPYPSERELLIEDLTKAFRQVSRLCKEFFDKQKAHSLTLRQPVTQPTLHINFNNYKGNFEPKTNYPQTIASFDVDADSSQQDLKPKFKDSSNNLQLKDSTKIAKDTTKIIKGQIKPSIPPVKGNIPLPPKAPLSPYFIFYKEKKDVIKEEFPEMSVTEITTAAGKVWKNLTEEEKEPFNRKFFEEKEKYEREMKAYVKKYPNYKEIFKKVGPGSTNNSKN